VKKPAIMLCLLLLAGLVCPIFGGMNEAYAMEGGGTEADPFIIMTPEDLSDVRNDPGAYYKLGTDINLAGYDYDGDGPDNGGWMPIDNFTGTLNGNGYAILNMTIDRPSTSDVGLFGKIGAGGNLVNLRLLDVDVRGNVAAGGVAGNPLAGATIERSYATGRVHADTNAGGLTGVNVGTIRNSYAIVDVSGGARVGGLTGTNAGEIKNAFSAGSVRGYEEIGGLTGYNVGQIQYAYAAGKVNGSLKVGGLTGRLDSGGAAVDSFWNTETSGQSASAAGTGKSTIQMKDADTFAGWDAADWGFRDGQAFPYLRTFPMAIGIDPLASATYSLHPGQDALSVTGSVYHESDGEPIAIKYVIREDGAGVIVAETANSTADENGELPFKHKFPLAGFGDGSYTVSVTATDAHYTIASASLGFTVDQAAPPPPSVDFGPNGSELWAQTASSTVTVNDTGDGVDAASLQYAWSADPIPPAPGSSWTAFASGDSLSRSGVDGDWYLHIQAKDLTDRAANVMSNRFRLDTSLAELRSLSLSAGSLNVAFDGGVYDYSASVAGARFAVTPSSPDATDTITVSVNGGAAQPVANGDASGPLALKVGANTVAVTVTALNGAQHTYTITVTRPAPPSVSVDEPVAVFIDVNGVPLNPAEVDTSKPSVTLKVTPKDDRAYVSMPASILADFATRNASFLIEIQAPYGSYRIPVNLASLIPELQDWLAASRLKSEDIRFRIDLIDKTGDKDIETAFASSLPEGQVMGAIVDFHIAVINAKTGQAIGTADQFSKPLTRVIPMPGNIIDMPAQWGAFRYREASKKFAFVPAQAVKIDGAWYVMIRSYSNSVYVTSRNAVSFNDVQKHWGQSYIQLAAAKGLVEGVGDGKYAPDQSVTRAEFAAMLVRALGRGAAAGSMEPYSDVKQEAWYSDEVRIAKELGLLDFAGGTRFKPDQPLIREEMASMLAAAIALEDLTVMQADVGLNGYQDIGSVNAAYLEDIRLMVKLNIMTGTSEDTFSPKSETTRAQAASVFVRTLQAIGMID